MRLMTTGEVANILQVSLRRVDLAIKGGHAGRIVFAGGRRLLTRENLRALARHFGRPIPPEGLSDLDPKDLLQGQGK